MKTDDTKETVR